MILDEAKEIPERISELERIWPIMQAKFQSYEGLFLELEKAKSEIVSLKAKLEDHSSTLGSVDDMQKSFSNYIQQKFDFLTDHVNGINTKVEKSMANQEVAKNELHDKVKDTHFSLKSIIDKVSEKIGSTPTLVDFGVFSDKAQEKYNGFQSEVDKIKVNHVELLNVLSNMKNDFSSGKNEVSGISGKISDLSNQMLNLLNAFESLKQFSSSQIYSASQKTQQDFEEKLKGLKAELKTAPDDLRTEFEKKLEGITLDGSNAVIKSTNTAAQVGIIEKKIENLYLLLKQVQLAK